MIDLLVQMGATRLAHNKKKRNHQVHYCLLASGEGERNFPP